MPVPDRQGQAAPTWVLIHESCRDLMPPLRPLKTPIPSALAMGLVCLGMTAGTGLWLWQRDDVSGLGLNPGRGSMDSLTAERGKIAPSHLTSPLAAWQSSGASSLAVPPPIIPQPLPPQAIWPPLANRVGHPEFTDVSADHWVYPVLADLAQHQLVSGFPNGSFRPDAPMTRAEFAAVLTHLFQLSQPSQGDRYPDVDPSHWASHDIQTALQMRFLTGYPDRTFRPNQEVTRLQVVVALANGLSLSSSRRPDSVLKPYSDAQQVPPWAKPPLVAALEAGLVAPYPKVTRLDLNRAASRAEVMAIMHQALVYTGSLSPLPME